MEIVQGTGEKGKLRELRCSSKDGQISLWIYTPGASNQGYSIIVSPYDLLAALIRVIFGRKATD